MYWLYLKADVYSQLSFHSRPQPYVSHRPPLPFQECYVRPGGRAVRQGGEGRSSPALWLHSPRSPQANVRLGGDKSTRISVLNERRAARAGTGRAERGGVCGWAFICWLFLDTCTAIMKITSITTIKGGTNAVYQQPFKSSNNAVIKKYGEPIECMVKLRQWLLVTYVDTINNSKSSPIKRNKWRFDAKTRNSATDAVEDSCSEMKHKNDWPLA